MSAQPHGHRSFAADARAVIGEVGQLCCQTPIMSGAVRQGEPEKEMANCERAAGKRESHFFAPGARAPAPRAIGERANTDWRSASVVRSVFARSPRCHFTSERGPRQGRQGAQRATQAAEAKGRSDAGLAEPQPEQKSDKHTSTSLPRGCHKTSSLCGNACGKGAWAKGTQNGTQYPLF